MLTPDQRDAILNVLGLNVVHNQGQKSTLTTGNPDNPTDKFSRTLTIKPVYTITLDDADGIYHVGDHITGAVTMNSTRSWNIAMGTSDGQATQQATGKRLTFDFVANTAGYLVLKASTVRPWVDPDAPGVFNQTVLVRVLPQGQSLPPWQEQAWLALKGADNVPGDAINRNRRITALYAQMYSSSPDVFKWAGMAALASKLVGDGLAVANQARVSPFVALFGPDPDLGCRLLSQGNLDLFMDMYPQTLAFRAGPAHTNMLIR